MALGTIHHRPVTTRTDFLSAETLTYAALGQRLNCSSEAARALVKRLRLPRQKANDGRTLVTVDLAEIEHRALPARSTPGHASVAETTQARIAPAGAQAIGIGGLAPVNVTVICHVNSESPAS
jgi:hypothetical protein